MKVSSSMVSGSDGSVQGIAFNNALMPEKFFSNHEVNASFSLAFVNCAPMR